MLETISISIGFPILIRTSMYHFPPGIESSKIDEASGLRGASNNINKILQIGNYVVLIYEIN